MELAMPKMVYMEVDLNNKELPLRIADTAAELAKMCRTTENNVLSTTAKTKYGRKKGRFIRVWIGDDED